MPWMVLSLSSMALDSRFPAGITALRKSAVGQDTTAIIVGVTTKLAVALTNLILILKQMTAEQASLWLLFLKRQRLAIQTFPEPLDSLNPCV